MRILNLCVFCYVAQFFVCEPVGQGRKEKPKVVKTIILNRLLGLLQRKMVYCSCQIFLPESLLHFYKSTIPSCLKHFRHIWLLYSAMYLDIIEKIQRKLCNFIGAYLVSRLHLCSHCRNVASVFYFYKYIHGNYSDSDCSYLLPWLH